MKNKMRISILLLLLFSLILVGCGTDDEDASGNDDPQAEDPADDGSTDTENGEEETDELTYTHDFDLEGEVDFWSWDTMFEDVILEFNKLYPNINVNLTVFEHDELHDTLYTTISAGSGAPDVSHIGQGPFTRFQADGLFEDLLQPEYNLQRYEHLQSDYNWGRWKSVDGERLLGTPWDLAPGVLFYRHDLYEEVGLPSDPEELGEYLQDPDNLITAAQTLAANDMYMYEWRDSPAVQYGDSLGYFDSELNYLRNDEKMIEQLDLVKQLTQVGWAAQRSLLWDDEGQQLVNQGRAASIPLGSNGARVLEETFPEQSGNWRVTRMPLGLSFGVTGSTFSIPSQSENKDTAWAFVEFLNFSEEAWKVYIDKGVQPGWDHINELPWYLEHENEFLGGQKEYEFYETLADEIPVRRLTPLDGLAWPIYIDTLNESIDNNIDSRTTLQQIEDNTLSQLAPEIAELKEELGLE